MIVFQTAFSQKYSKTNKSLVYWTCSTKLQLSTFHIFEARSITTSINHHCNKECASLRSFPNHANFS